LTQPNPTHGSTQLMDNSDLTCRNRPWDNLKSVEWDVKPLLTQFCTAGLREFCQFDQFEANCESDEVVLIEAARYGRMRSGRCISGEGYIGCSADVRVYLDGQCSGKLDCEYYHCDEFVHSVCLKSVLVFIALLWAFAWNKPWLWWWFIKTANKYTKLSILGRIECIRRGQWSRSVVCPSVYLSVTRLRSAKTAEWIDILFVLKTISGAKQKRVSNLITYLCY